MNYCGQLSTNGVSSRRHLERVKRHASKPPCDCARIGPASVQPTRLSSRRRSTTPAPVPHNRRLGRGGILHSSTDSQMTRKITTHGRHRWTYLGEHAWPAWSHLRNVQAPYPVVDRLRRSNKGGAPTWGRGCDFEKAELRTEECFRVSAGDAIFPGHREASDAVGSPTRRRRRQCC